MREWILFTGVNDACLSVTPGHIEILSELVWAALVNQLALQLLVEDALDGAGFGIDGNPVVLVFDCGVFIHLRFG